MPRVPLSRKRLAATRMRVLLPGLLLKRWLLMSLVGFGLALFGLTLLLNLQPITQAINLVTQIAPLFPSWLSGSLFLSFGLVMSIVGLMRTKAVLRLAAGERPWFDDLVESLYRINKLDRGPKVVAIGGGTGLSTLLRGLKHHTSNITAVVTVGDDGGSSGRLRTEQKIIPPGDIRNCIAALSDEEQLTTALFQYRFTLGQGLEGHSFGNLFLTAMCRITGDMMSAIKESSKVLNIRGQVLPSTLEPVTLVAELADGTFVRGESNIPEAGQRIKRLFSEPEQPAPLPEVLEAIKDADLIILGPGSLYTSVLPNMLLSPVAQAVLDSKAPTVYIANMVSQPGETDGFTVADHIAVLEEHTPDGQLIDVVFVNSQLPEPLLNRYKGAGAQEVVLDSERLEALKVGVVKQSLYDQTKDDTIRHDPAKVARAVMRWYRKRLVK